MSPVRLSVLVAAVAACLLGLPRAAVAQDPGSLPGGQPPLTAEPPEPLGGGPAPTPTPTPAPSPEPGPPAEHASPGQPQLPATGAEAAVLAAAGIGMLATGMGLRIQLAATDGGGGA